MNKIKENTNLRTIVIVLVISALAFLCLLGGAKIPDTSPTWKSLLTSVGSLLFASVAIAVIWELFQKRSFTNEILDYIKLSENIESSGIESIHFRFDELDWKELFENCTEFDLFITYGRSWRGSNEIRLREVAKRAGSKVRIVLPDYRESELLRHFSVRYRKTEEEVANLIKDAVKEYSDYFDEETCDFKLRLTKHPTNGYYRFGRTDKSSPCTIITTRRACKIFCVKIFYLMYQALKTKYIL